MKRTVTRLIVGISILVLAAVIMPLLIYNSPFIVGAEGSFIVQTNSMEPAIPTDSLILVYRQEPDQIREGDVITFYANVEGRIIRITHRVIQISEFNGEYHYLTKGDANRNPDPIWVPEENVIGEVKVVVPGLGGIIETHRSNPLIAALIVAPALVIILYEIGNIMRERRNSINYIRK